jgi:Tetratricopeptide repeat
MVRVLGSLLRSAALVLLVATPAVSADPPKLTKAQRDVLQAVVSAVDAATRDPATSGLDWQVHVLRASDGSHYVAFSVIAPADARPTGPVMLYVRLASRPSEPTQLTERSAVLEWLKGLRSDPLPMRAARVVRVPIGELPIGGPSSMTTGAGSRDGTASAGQALAALALMEREREREKEEREEQERRRKAELEGKGQGTVKNALYPFEDFDIAATSVATASGAAALERAFTAGPGEYDLYVGWAAPTGKGAVQPRVVKRRLSLPPASTSEFALSSLIFGDDVKLGATPYPADRQTAHPYSIGGTAIVPARDDSFTNDDRLVVVFQVVNPAASLEGKPDVAVGFRLFQETAGGETPFATLNPQYYDATTLPVDFDLRLGHPIFAAMAAPLATLPRGTFRLNVTATDRNSRRVVSADTTFKVVATVGSLLRAAPSAAPAFRRDAMLDTPILHAVVSRLTPSAPPSPVLARALSAAAERRFVEVLREDGFGPDEQATAAVLRGMALYALGDSSRAVALPFRRALELNAPPGTAQVYLAACQAIDGYDRSAIGDWEAAIEAGIDRSALVPLLVDAHLRLGNSAAAQALAAAFLAEHPGDPAVTRGMAAALLATGRSADAIALLDASRIDAAGDPDTQYVLLKALFEHALNPAGAAKPDSTERFHKLARAYVDAHAVHAEVVAEWIQLVK